MGETSSVGGATKYGPEEGEWFPVEDDRDDDTELVGMPPIENLFTVVPSTILHEEHTRDERGDGKDSDGKSSNRATTKP